MLLVAAIALVFWRKPYRGMRLKFKGGERPLPSLFGRRAESRAVNVIFNYNGHSWDAFEVLGLPAGSSMERVEQAFQEACDKTDAESRSFLEAAYKAIRESA